MNQSEIQEKLDKGEEPLSDDETAFLHEDAEEVDEKAFQKWVEKGRS
jgi:hypothetical protein